MSASGPNAFVSADRTRLRGRQQRFLLRAVEASVEFDWQADRGPQHAENNRPAQPRRLNQTNAPFDSQKPGQCLEAILQVRIADSPTPGAKKREQHARQTTAGGDESRAGQPDQPKPQNAD